MKKFPGDSWIEEISENLTDPDSPTIEMYGHKYPCMIAALALASKCSPVTIDILSRKLMRLLLKEQEAPKSPIPPLTPPHDEPTFPQPRDDD